MLRLKVNKSLQTQAVAALLVSAALLAGCDPAPEVSQSTNGTLTFAGYECTQDCSGHLAGYNWAEEKGIADPNDCGGKSRSFIEGCIAYAERN